MQACMLTAAICCKFLRPYFSQARTNALKSLHSKEDTAAAGYSLGAHPMFYVMKVKQQAAARC
jgi:hypothetical protein